MKTQQFNTIYKALVVQTLDSEYQPEKNLFTEWITQLVSLYLFVLKCFIRWIALSNVWTTGYRTSVTTYMLNNNSHNFIFLCKSFTVSNNQYVYIPCKALIAFPGLFSMFDAVLAFSSDWCLEKAIMIKKNPSKQTNQKTRLFRDLTVLNRSRHPYGMPSLISNHLSFKTWPY